MLRVVLLVGPPGPLVHLFVCCCWPWQSVVLSQLCAAEFTPIVGWDHQIYPSYLVATATMGVPATNGEMAANDQDDAAEQADDEDDEVEQRHQRRRRPIAGRRPRRVGRDRQAPSDGAAVRVTIASDGVLEESSFSGTLATEGATYAIFPRVKWKYDVLAANKQSQPLAVTYRVSVGDEDAEEETATLTLLDQKLIALIRSPRR